MTRRRKIALLSIGAISLAALIPALVYQYFSPPDPIIGELRFSDHLLRAFHTPLSLKTRPSTQTDLMAFRSNAVLRSKSQHALSKAGPEVLPLIINWLGTDTPAWKSNLQARLQSQGYDFPRLAANRRAIAWRFLAAHPIQIDTSALPLFASVITNGSRQDNFFAAMAIPRMLKNSDQVDVEPALRILLPLFHNLQSISPGGADPFGTRESTVAMSIDGCIQQLDPQYLYRPLLILELGPAPERVGAAMHLADFPRFPERAIPLLVANLNSTNRAVQQNCARALGKFGHQARPALPALTNLLHHPRDFVRLAASNAINSITQADPSP